MEQSQKPPQEHWCNFATRGLARFLPVVAYCTATVHSAHCSAQPVGTQHSPNPNSPHTAHSPIMNQPLISHSDIANTNLANTNLQHLQCQSLSRSSA